MQVIMLGIIEHKFLGLIENDKKYKHYVLLNEQMRFIISFTDSGLICIRVTT